MKDQSLYAWMKRNFHHFNAGAMMRAVDDYKTHLNQGGKMLVAMGGAMSSARIGVSLAPMIRQGKVHAISCTGANLEESVFRLVAHKHYHLFPDYRYFKKEDDEKILNDGHRRVTDMSIPEDEAFRKIEGIILDEWQKAQASGERYFHHEFFYKILQREDLKQHIDGDPDECWLLAAMEKNLPIVVPGSEDSTLGNIFAGYCQSGELKPTIMKSGIEYMVKFYEQYQELSQAPGGLGFFQIGGGISGDFPICVVPSLKYDVKTQVKPWSYFCQISDSTTSYGSYSGATPNEKITWDKLTVNTPMHVIESDATIVAPMMFEAILETDEK